MVHNMLHYFQVYPNLGYLNKGNHAWFCLGLLDMLCQLAERGHATSVRLMLDYPLTHYPEILLLGVSHISVRALFVRVKSHEYMFGA